MMTWVKHLVPKLTLKYPVYKNYQHLALFYLVLYNVLYYFIHLDSSCLWKRKAICTHLLSMQFSVKENMHAYVLKTTFCHFLKLTLPPVHTCVCICGCRL